MKHSSKDNSFHFKIDENNLEVQDQKLKVLYFEKDEPITLLEEFERKIRQNSSEFRFLPEEDEISKSIDRQFYDLLYSDNVNKIRSLEGFKTNKYGVSKTLSKLLALVNDVHGITKHYKEDILQRIRAFFAGARAIDLIIYSEKALTYYAFIDSLQEFYNMFESILNSIFITTVYVNGEKKEEETNDLRRTLVDHLLYSMSFAASYNPGFVDPVEFEKRKKEIGYKKGTELLKYLNYVILQKNMKRITKANMMRHNLIKIPLSNYLSDSSFHNIMKGKLDVESDKFDQHKIKFSPRFIHRGEIQLFYDLQQFFSISNKPEDNVKKISDKITADFKEFNSLSPDYVENDPVVEVLND